MSEGVKYTPRSDTNTLKQSTLSDKQKAFIAYYLEDHNITQAAIKAGYSARTAGQAGSRLLKDVKIRDEIGKLEEERRKSSIATAQEVMEYFTKVMNGEIKDQFGLDAPLSERTRAAQELAKRTIDLENRVQGKADAVVEIKLDWNME